MRNKKPALFQTRKTFKILIVLEVFFLESEAIEQLFRDNKIKYCLQIYCLRPSVPLIHFKFRK